MSNRSHIKPKAPGSSKPSHTVVPVSQMVARPFVVQTNDSGLQHSSQTSRLDASLLQNLGLQKSLRPQEETSTTNRRPLTKTIGPISQLQTVNHSMAAPIQRAMGDGHDLRSPRFAGDTTLEAIYDGNGTLKKGNNGDAVRKVQHGIHDAGILFLGHGVDGKFGRETERRVTRFQTRQGISSDPVGEVGTATITKLDRLYPPMALPSTASDPYTFAGMLDLLCQWNAAMIKDLKNLRVQMVGRLEWADEKFDGTNWVPKPMSGAGETSGLSIIIATNGTNEQVAQALYHEYQHARSPVVYRRKDWADEESRVYTMETNWSIDRGLTPDPNLTTTDPVTGDVELDQAGIDSTVESYPGLDTANPGEVIGKAGANRVRVRMPDGRVTIRAAVAGDSVEGPRRIVPPRHVVQDQEWQC